MDKIQVSHFLVYVLTCLVDGVRRTYIGMTGVLKGQSDDAALLVRRRFHIGMRKSWLAGMSVSTLKLSKVLSNLSEADAQVEEAWHTAKLLESVKDFTTIRGGPWCRKQWTHDDRLEVEEVRACTSRFQVRSLMSVFPKGSLAKHLTGGSYRNQVAEVPGASGSESGPAVKLIAPLPPPASSSGSSSSSTSARSAKAKREKPRKGKSKALRCSSSRAISAAKPPVVCVAPKRQSGKGAPGRKRKPGVDGHVYRQSIHCNYGDADYERLKYGNDPQAVKNKAQQTYRVNKKPASASAKRPAFAKPR